MLVPLTHLFHHELILSLNYQKKWKQARLHNTHKTPRKKLDDPHTLTQPSPIHPVCWPDCSSVHYSSATPASERLHSFQKQCNTFCPCHKWSTKKILDPTSDLRHQRLKCRTRNAEPELPICRYKTQQVHWNVITYKFIWYAKLYAPFTRSLSYLFWVCPKMTNDFPLTEPSMKTAE